MVLNSLYAHTWSQYVKLLMSVPFSAWSWVRMASVCCGGASALMKMLMSTPLRHWIVARETPCLRTRAIPTIVSETATHKMAPVVISTFLRRLLPVSLATYSIERAICEIVLGRGSYQGSAGMTSAVALDAAVLVTHAGAPVELDHPLVHAVDDPTVVGGHHHRRPGPVDPMQEAHDALRRRGVQVAGGLVGQED